MIALIFGISRNKVIGCENKLPWCIPADLAYFKKVTMGYPVIMGRKTYESIGRPLPGRKNIIITRDSSFEAPGCVICNSKEQALLEAGNDAFIIGGADIYKQFIDDAQKMYVTYIDEDFKGDTKLDNIDFSQWELVSFIKGTRDEKNPYDYYFKVYEKKRF